MAIITIVMKSTFVAVSMLLSYKVVFVPSLFAVIFFNRPVATICKRRDKAES